MYAISAFGGLMTLVIMLLSNLIGPLISWQNDLAFISKLYTIVENSKEKTKIEPTNDIENKSAGNWYDAKD